jgi:predicted porin
LLCGAGVLSTHTQAQSNDFVDVSAALHHDDNISRALLSSDRHGDANLEFALSGGRLIQLRSPDTLTLFGSITANRFERFDGLDSNSLNLGASLQHKFGLGAYAPALSSGLSWTRHESETKIRTRDLLELNVEYRKRLSPEWDLAAGVAYEINDGRNDGAVYSSKYSPNNDIYDFEQASVFATLDYTFRNFSSLSASYSYVDGNTVSSALAPNPALLAIANALAPDGAFPAPSGRTIVAYTLATKAHLFSLNWSFPIGRDSSLTAGYNRQQIEARRGVDYTNDRVSLTFLHILK